MVKFVFGFIDGVIELFVGWDDKVLVYVGFIDGKCFGIFVNLLENMNNMVCVFLFNVYFDVFLLFERLGFFVLFFLDILGIDLCLDGINCCVIMCLVELSG